MSSEPSLLEVRERGERTVVGFRDPGARLFLSSDFCDKFREELETLISVHQCHTLAIDMAPVKYIDGRFFWSDYRLVQGWRAD